MSEQNQNGDGETLTTKQWIAVFGSMLGAFMAILDIQITNASVQQVTGGLGATLEDGSWISTSYLVAEIIIIPLSGFFAHVFSLRKYLIWTSILFLISSVLCGFSWNLGSMIVFRACQGFTGGALIPLAFQVILQLPVSKRTIGMAMFSITATFAPAIGPTIGGWLTDVFSWPVIFYMNIIPGVFMLGTVIYAVPKEKEHREMLKTMDVPGIVTMAIGLGCLTVFLEEGERKDWFGSHLITTLAIMAVVFIGLFLYIEFTTEKPVINLRLFKKRNFALGSLVNFSAGLALYGALYLLPQYLGSVQGYSPFQIGETMMWSGLPQLLVVPIVPQLLKKFDARWVTFVGINLFALSCFMNSYMDVYTALDQLKWSQIVRAIGQPLFMVPLSSITMGQISKEQSGSASGLFNMLRNLGGSVGIAMLSTEFTWREQFHSVRLNDHINVYSEALRERMQLFVSYFESTGMDHHTAWQSALAGISGIVRQQAYIMGFNDAFFLVGIALVIASLMILSCAKVAPGAGGGEGAH